VILRGDILMVDFGERGEAEVSFKRPAVVVSNDFANQYGRVVIVVPLTSQGLKNIYPMHLPVPKETSGLDRDSKAQVELMSHIHKERILRVMGKIPKNLQAALDTRIREHLGL
jgi:mRNA interferase MazF